MAVSASSLKAARLAGALPRLSLAQLPTPLDHASRLTARLGGPRIWIKREDLSGLAFGGNKPRQLEFIMAAAHAEGADAIITTAGIQSNFCRTAAAAAARLGMRAGLLLRGRGDESLQGNYLLDRLFGADIRFIDTADPYDARVLAALDAFVDDYRARGLKPYVVHLPGRTGALSAAAYATAAEELATQFTVAGIAPRALYVAAGSGLSVAGLALGFKHLGVTTRVMAVSVQQAAGFIVPLIVRRAAEAAELLGIAARLEAADFGFDETQIGAAYGVPTEASLAAMLLVARQEGLVLDPVYTGKVMAGLVADVARGAWGRGDDVVFLHSGGGPSVFAYADVIAAAASRAET